LKYNNNLDLSSIPLELRLLLYCLRSCAGQDYGDRIGTLCRRAIDWDIFIRLVARHGVPSPIYKTLKRFAGEIVPEPVLTVLRDRFHRNAKQVVGKTAELVRIVKRFQQNDINVLALKGPVLALQVYDDLGSRHVGDLDILVPPERVLEAQRLLLQEGYRRIHPRCDMTPRQQSAHLQKGQHLELYCDEKRIKVELHWRYGSPRGLFPLKFHDAWKERQTVRLGSIDVATLSIEHTILFLCTHGAYHAWFRIFWLYDLALLFLKYPAIDWNILMRHSGQLGIHRMVAEGVVLANQLFGSPLPQQVFLYTQKDKEVLRLVKMSLYLIKYCDRALDVPFTPAFFYNTFHRFMLQNNPRYKL